MQRFTLGLMLSGASLLLLSACSAGVDDAAGGSGPGGTGSETTNGQGGTNFVTSSGNGTGGGVVMNPCGTECGPTELCDGIHRGLDDNCDGDVDEGCPCGPGEASSCFKGDPSFRDSAGCYPGTMQCTENGTWGPCMGGNHATEGCFSANPTGCHPISAVPFQTVNLRNGTGTFDDNAQSDMFDVACPPGVNPCPAVAGDSFQPLVSGEYTVTYTKTVGGNAEQCSFPVYVGARGLRVELTWNYPMSGGTTDLDLHMHEPMATTPWATSGAAQDCGFANCTSYNFLFPFGNQPEWFPSGNVAPDPVNWYIDPVFEQNLCYFAPRGAGDDWSGAMQGCHNPRLDLDNITCDPSSSDPESASFCAPENINVDFPPQNQWTRIAVHYYPGTSSYSGATRPNVKIFCEGALAAELGTYGYNNPESPVTWSGAQNQDDIWMVADVLFRKDECSNECIVRPIYADEAQKAPLIVSSGVAESSFSPPYPPMP